MRKRIERHSSPSLCMHYDPTRVDSSPFYLYRTEPSGQSFQRSSACIRTWKGWVFLGLLMPSMSPSTQLFPTHVGKMLKQHGHAKATWKRSRETRTDIAIGALSSAYVFFLGITNTGDWKVHTFDAGQEPSQGNPDLTPGDFPAPPVSDQSNLQRSIGEGCGG